MRALGWVPWDGSPGPCFALCGCVVCLGNNPTCSMLWVNRGQCIESLAASVLPSLPYVLGLWGCMEFWPSLDAR